MTWKDLVNKYFPNATSNECESILWSETSFPIGSVSCIEKQLKDFHMKSMEKIKT